MEKFRVASLEGLSAATVAEAFASAFADYDTAFSTGQILSIFKRRGFDPALSFAAFDGDGIAAFVCNGTGLFDGRRTAYDTGTGTLPAYRGQRLTARIFDSSLPVLRERGIEQYLLEVLQHNTRAVSIYRKAGFEISREFAYLGQRCDRVENRTAAPLIPCEIRAVEDCEAFASFADFRPSWQNGFESVRRAGCDLVRYGLFVDGEPAGYVIFDPRSGDLTQLAVRPELRRKGFGSLLLRRMLAENRSAVVRAINVEKGCDSLMDFLRAKRIVVDGMQFEMVKRL